MRRYLQVRGPDGKPLAHASIYTVPGTGSPQDWREAGTTDEQGRYVIDFDEDCQEPTRTPEDMDAISARLEGEKEWAKSPEASP